MNTPELTVLVVDDDFLVAKVHTRFVEQVDGFVVVGVAHGGADAVRLAAEVQPDLVLLDVHLPDLSGLEVLRRLRADGIDADVLMVTAERDAEAVQQARATGAAGYLVKPFTREELAARLDDVRQAREHLAGFAARADPEQADIDRVFGAPASGQRGPLPKGLNRNTADLVLAALAGGELTAAACADQVGLARVTALSGALRRGRPGERPSAVRPGGPARAVVRPAHPSRVSPV